MTIFRHGSEVASVIPAFLVDSLAGCLLVHVVTCHHVRTSGHDLTSDVLRVATQDLHFHTIYGLATRTTHEVVVVAERDERCTLGGTIAHSDGEVDGEQKLFHLFRQGGATYDNLVHLATKGVENLLTDTLLDLLAHDRHLQQQAHAVVLYLGEYFLANDLLDDQWNGDNHGWLYLSESLRDDGGTRQTGEEEQMTTIAEAEHEFYCHTIHVGHGQDAQHVVASLHVTTQDAHDELYVAPDGAVG